MRNAASTAIDWSEQGLLPDTVIRHGVKRLLKKRIAALHTDDCEALAANKAAFIQSMHDSAIAPLPFKANEQHYEVPTEFFLNVLGDHSKYSCCYWGAGTTELDAAETSLDVQILVSNALDGTDIQTIDEPVDWGEIPLPVEVSR